MSDFVLRHNDFSLDDTQKGLRDTFKSFVNEQCPPERVREAEPIGWDADLWKRFTELRSVAMGLPESVGGDGGGLVELAIVAEQVGRRAAPVPFVETVVAARLLAGLDGDGARRALDDILDGGVASVSLASAGGMDGDRVLVAAGACAAQVVAVRDGDLVLATADGPPPAVENMADAPLAWWRFGDAEVLTTGDAAATAITQAEDELRLLTAAALVGLGAALQHEGVQYAKDREAFGVPIGTFQAIAHPLADVATAVEAARRLTRKASWYGDFEPTSLGPMATLAFLQASRAALLGGQVAIHTQGGFGFTLESDAQLYYRRAKGWSLLVGRQDDELQRLTDQVQRAREEDA